MMTLPSRGWLEMQIICVNKWFVKFTLLRLKHIATGMFTPAVHTTLESVMVNSSNLSLIQEFIVFSVTNQPTTIQQPASCLHRRLHIEMDDLTAPFLKVKAKHLNHHLVAGWLPPC